MRRFLVIGLLCLVTSASATSFLGCGGDDSGSSDTVGIPCELGAAALTERALNELKVGLRERGIGALIGTTIAGHYISSGCSDFLNNLSSSGISGVTGPQ